jgi:hypothetical protein
MPYVLVAPPPRQSAFGTFVRLALVGVFVLCVVASFAYVAGWLSPRRLTQAPARSRRRARPRRPDKVSLVRRWWYL